MLSSPAALSSDPLEVLQRVFGYASFRGSLDLADGRWTALASWLAEMHERPSVAATVPSAPTPTNIRTALDLVHAVMCVPYDWSPETLDAIAGVLASVGYSFPDEDESAALDRSHGQGVVSELVAALAPWQPANEVTA